MKSWKLFLTLTMLQQATNKNQSNSLNQSNKRLSKSEPRKSRFQRRNSTKKTMPCNNVKAMARYPSIFKDLLRRRKRKESCRRPRKKRRSVLLALEECRRMRDSKCLNP